MAQEKTFTLIGNFTDNITPKIESVNKSLDSMRRSMSAFSAKGSGFDSVTKSIGKVVAAHKHLSSEVRNLRSEVSQTNSELRQYSVLLNRVNRSSSSYRRNVSGMVSDQSRLTAATNSSTNALQRQISAYNRLQRRPPGLPPAGRTLAQGGMSTRGGGESRRGVVGDVIRGSLITNAIISGFQYGTALFQSSIAKVFGLFAERTKDQLEDIASAGGIFSAAKFGGAKGLPATFQGALEMQDSINKEVAAIASALPGTTQDYVMNARRMTDTLAQVMTKDTKNFENLAKKLSGDISIQGAKAFEVVNVEVAKATTLLEKLNPTRTVVPMTQIVEDMMKSDKVTIAGLRRYVSFRRATTFEAALNRNLKDLNKTGQGTAARLEAITKVLKEAVPPELITAMTTSVSGIIEGFKSAMFDPDVGIFGLSRALSISVAKFDKETGAPMINELGKQMEETTTFFKLFADVFGNIGNLINAAIVPGIAAIYNPFDLIAKGLEELREVSFEIFRRQQSYTAYFSNLAEKYGMSVGNFKAGEKGGVGVLLDVLATFQMFDPAEGARIVDLMAKKGSAEQIEKDMKGIYKRIIPAIIDSPFFTKIGSVLGDVLARTLTVIADTIGALMGRTMPKASAFVDSFKAGGGLTALNRIIVYIAEIIGKVILTLAQVWGGALLSSVASGNFAAAGLLASPLLMVPGVMSGAGALGGAVTKKLLKKREGKASGTSGKGGVRYGGTDPAVLRRFEGPRSVAFRAMASRNIVNPQFPYLALPGQYPAIGGLTQPGRAPGIPPRRVAPPRGPLATLSKVARAFKSMAVGSMASLLISPRTAPILNQIGRLKPLVSGPGAGALRTPGTLLKSSGALGPLSIVTSIISAISSLLRGDSLATALGEGAGPLIGSAIGFALLGPLGSFIGAWIGSMDAVTKPLADAFQSLWGSLSTLGQFLVQIGSDINGLIRMVPGVKDNFNLLGFAVFAILSPFKLLEIAINGIYDLYLTIKSRLFGGLTADERKRLNEKRTQRATDEFTVMGDLAKGISLAEQRKKNYDLFLNAKRMEDTEKQNKYKAYIDAIDRVAKGRGVNLSSTKTDKIADEQESNLKVSNQIGKEQNSAYLLINRNWQRLDAKSRENILRSSKNLSGAMDMSASSVRSSSSGLASFWSTPATFAYNGNLGNAVMEEMSNMPAGANLMVANTSETVLPKRGWGSVAYFNSIASRFGLQMTSHYRKGDPGWHGVNRARDYSNGVNTPQMMSFARHLVSNYGKSLLELIYTPLGFSIDKGRIVPPKAQSTHWNHVHVAYALGAGSPAFFSSANAARNWERKMAPKYTSISTVTGNSAEGFGSSNNINANFNIYQQPGQDPKELASMVAMELSMAIDTLRNH